MKKADFIVIAIVLAVAGVLVYFLYFNGHTGNFVQVEHNGEVIETISLDEDFEKEYSFDGETNKLVIKDGKAQVVEANCPDGICANHKPVNLSGESIICLPHKLVITVVDANGSDNEIDAVA